MEDDDAPIIFPIVLDHPTADDVSGGVAAAQHQEDQIIHQEEQQHQFHHHEASVPVDDNGDAAAALLDDVGDSVVPPLPSHQDYQDNGGAAPTVEMAAAPLKRDAEQDVATLNHEEAKRHKTPSVVAAATIVTTITTNPNKKDRREFTAAEKLRIINLLDGSRQEAVTTAEVPQQTTSLTNKQIREKFGVSKSSLHRWRQQKHRLEIMVQSDGLGTRKRDTKDPLEKIKSGLQQFYNENMEKGPDERLIITTPVVQAMAGKIRDELLAEYDAAMADAAAAAAIDLNNDGQQQQQQQEQQPLEPNLNPEELTKIRRFKVTKSWAGRVASQMGWLSQPRKKSSNLQQQQRGEEEVVEEQMAPVGQDGVATAVAALGSTAAPDDTIATNADDDAATEQAKLNTLAFLSKTHPDYSTTNPKVKKSRKEFTAQEKLNILFEMDPEQTSNPLVMAEICEKYSTSKSSVFRWKQQYRAGTLTQMIDEEGRGSFKRDVNDKLGKVKMRLKKYIEDNRAQPPETRELLSSGVLQAKAQQFRDELLAQYELDPSKSDLKDDEIDALRRFKASKGWARKAASRYGWTETEDPNYSVETALRTESAVLRREAAAAIAAAAEVSVDALMAGHGVPELPHRHAAGNDDVVMMQQSIEAQQDQQHHEDAVNEAMHSMIDGDLGTDEQYQV